jgi:hypothetical protein
VTYLVRIVYPFGNYKKGEEVFLSSSDLAMWKKFVKVLKKVKEKPDMVIK